MRELWDRILANFSQLPLTNRIGLGVAVLLIAAAASWVGIWSSKPEYIPLASELAPGEAASIISKLDAQNIRHELNFSGSTILVPKNEFSRARLVVGDTDGRAATGPDWTDSVLGDPSLNRYKMLRHQESTLANSIARMSGVSGAVVHVAQPDPSPFISEQESTTASVVVELKPGTVFTREQTNAIVALVSRSISGLTPDSVSVMDSRGRILSSASSEMEADVAGQFEYRRMLEADLSTKANLMLAQMLGEGKAIVRVTADVDFTRMQRTETIFDPNVKVRKKESTKNIQRSGGGSKGGTAGAATTASNLGEDSASKVSTNGSPFKETHEENETEYDTASTVDTITEAPGKLRRLTVAVMADLGVLKDSSETPAAAGGAPGTSPDAGGSVTKEDVQAIVKQAVGFDDERGDQIEVLVTELAGQQQEDEEFLTMQQWDFYRQLARSSSLGLASVAALILGLITLRRMRPVLVDNPKSAIPEDRDRRRSQTIQELSQRMKDNPEMAKAILSAWANDITPGPPGGIERRRRAA
jgi:flagellar M-ring protein FliF